MEEAVPPRVRKRSRKVTAGWNVFFSYSQVAYAIISGIFLVPLYLRFIPLELYGAWLASGNILAWFTVVDPGVSTVIMQRAGRAYGSGSLLELAAYVRAGVVLTGAISALLLLAGLLMAERVPGWIGFAGNPLASELSRAFVLAVVGTSFSFFSFAFTAAGLGMLGSVGPGMIIFISNFGSLLLTTVLLYHGFGVFAIAWALLFRGVFNAFGSFGYLLYRLWVEKIALRGGSSRLREMLGLLSFTSLSKIGSVFSRKTDAFLLARFLGPEIVPMFALTRRGMDIIETLLVRPANALSASISHLSGEAGQEKVRAIVLRILRLNAWLLALAGGGFFVFNEAFVRLWVGEELYAGALVSGLFCLVMVGRVVFPTMNVLCQALGEIKRSSLAIFAHSLITVVCLFFGVKYFGMIGAAAAPLGGNCLVYIWYFPKALKRRAGLTSADGLALMKDGGAAVGVVSLLLFVFMGARPESWWEFAFYVILFAGSFTAIMMLLFRSARSELLALKRAVLSRLGPRFSSYAK